MSAPKRFRGYRFTVEDWLALCEMHGNRCVRCGEEGFLTVDHIKPRASGGTDEISNIQPLCRSCNSRKNAIYEGQAWAQGTNYDGWKSRQSSGAGRTAGWKAGKTERVNATLKPSVKKKLGEIAAVLRLSEADALAEAITYLRQRRDIQDALRTQPALIEKPE